MDEAFLDMPSYGIHPQSLLMETTWICHWFERLLKSAQAITKRGGSHARTVYVADRSPYSAVLYCTHGQLLKPIIMQQCEEVHRHAGIEILTVMLRVEDEVLWQRIQARLEIEPDRVLYKEDSREWMDKVAGFYNSFDLWDVEVDNSDEDATGSLRALMLRTVNAACDAIPGLDTAVATVNAKLLAAARASRAEPEAGGAGATVAGLADAMCDLSVRARPRSTRVAAPLPGHHPQ